MVEVAKTAAQPPPQSWGTTSSRTTRTTTARQPMPATVMHAPTPQSVCCALSGCSAARPMWPSINQIQRGSSCSSCSCSCSSREQLARWHGCSCAWAREPSVFSQVVRCGFVLRALQGVHSRRQQKARCFRSHMGCESHLRRRLTMPACQHRRAVHAAANVGGGRARTGTCPSSRT